MIKESRPCFECLAHKHDFYSAKDMLNEYYWHRMMTTNQIGALLEVTGSAIVERLHFYNITLRSVGTAGRPNVYKRRMQRGKEVE